MRALQPRHLIVDHASAGCRQVDSPRPGRQVGGGDVAPHNQRLVNVCTGQLTAASRSGLDSRSAAVMPRACRISAGRAAVGSISGRQQQRRRHQPGTRGLGVLQRQRLLLR